MNIRVGGVPEHFNLPWHVAQEEGIFDTMNIQLSWTDFPGGTGAMVKALREEEIDMAIVLTEGITADILNGNPAVIVGFYVASPLIWGIHTGAKNDIKSLDDIAGKSYAISRKFSGSHLMAYVDADKRNLTIKDEQFIEVGNLTGAEEALVSGKADLFLWEKFTTKPLVDAGKFRRLGECPTPWPCFAFAVRKQFYVKHRYEIESLINFMRPYSSLQQSKNNYAKLVATRYGLKEEDVYEWLASLQYATGREDQNYVITSVVDQLKKTGVLTLDASFRNLV